MDSDHLRIVIGDREAEMFDIESCLAFRIFGLNQNVRAKCVRHGFSLAYDPHIAKLAAQAILIGEVERRFMI